MKCKKCIPFVVSIVVFGLVALSTPKLVAQGVGSDSLRLSSPAGGSAWISLPSATISSYRLLLPATLGSSASQLAYVNGTTGQMSLLSPGTTQQLLRMNGTSLEWISPETVAGSTAWSLVGNASTNPATMFLGTTDAQSLRILTNNTERIRVLSTGLVGIGTSSPTQLLHLSGGHLYLDSVSSGTAAQLRLANPLGTFYSAFKSGAQTQNLSYTLPTSAPTSGQVLSSDASANLSWVSLASLTNGTTTSSTLRWSGSSWVENLQVKTLAGALTLGSNSNAGSLIINDGQVSSNAATISLASLGAARSYTIPDAGASASFVMTEGAQTIGGTKSFTSNVQLTNSGTATELRLYEPSASGSHYSALKAQAQAASVTYTLPAADGSSGQVLSTNGSGSLSWASAATGTIGGSGVNTEVAFFTAPTTLGSSGNMVWDNTNSRLGIFASSPSARLQVGGRILANIGTDNTFLSGGNETVSGTLNTGVGYNSLALVSSGGSNVAMGRNTLSSLTTTSNNTAVGTGALGITTGSNNIALGYQAGDALSTGSNNIIIGYNIDAPSASGSNQLSIGNLIYGTSVNGSQTSISSGNIGIGSSAPSQRLHVAGNILVDTSAASTAGKLIFNNPARTFSTSIKAGAQAANIDYVLPTAAPSAGQYLQSDASGNLSWQSASSSNAISALTVAAATNTINNADYAQTWQWNSLGATSALTLSSSSTAAASNAQKLLNLTLTGANATSTQTTY